MNVLVIGGGGREHALCWALSRAATVFCAPGNPGTAQNAVNIPIDVSDSRRVLEAIRHHRIDLTVVGPEAPLAAGLADRLTESGYLVFGPSAGAAQIEASKAFAKDVMRAAEVSTAGSGTFWELDDALRYIDGHAEPLVVKASGLAAGKGAVVCESRTDAREAARQMFGGRFGAAGSTVVVESFLQGEELSVFGLTDGEQVLCLPPAQDHKRLLDGDRGPNTGGMGAYTPVSLATDALLERIEHDIFQPTLRELARRGIPYAGVLYAGLMISAHGDPAVVEFNCRLGDPEAQVVLPVTDTDLLDHFANIAAGNWRPSARRLTPARAAVTTVLAAPGYPGAPVHGSEISVPDDLDPDTILFHAGTRMDGDRLTTSGGRVLCATGLGDTVASAAAASRRLADEISFQGKHYRTDIGWREIERSRTG